MKLNREISVQEWFTTIENAEDDKEVVRILLSNLDGYIGTPPKEDLIQFVHFLTAVRMHQIKNMR